MGNNVYEVVLFWEHSKGKTWHVQARTFEEAVEKTKEIIRKWSQLASPHTDFKPFIFIESVSFLFELNG